MFGMNTSIYYTVITKPYSWEVKRKMKDFIQLRIILVKLFPNKIIPPLEQDEHENSVHKTNKKMKFLKGFLNDLRDIKEVWTCSYVISFLSLNDDKKYEKIMKESENKKDLEKLENVMTFTGSA